MQLPTNRGSSKGARSSLYESGENDGELHIEWSKEQSSINTHMVGVWRLILVS